MVLDDVVGVILAGGLGRRMGGVDKAFAPLGGEPLIAHVIARLQPQLRRLVINANGDARRFAHFGLPVVADTLPDHPGPLAGVLAGMDWAAAHGARHIVTASTDTPFLPQTFVQRLMQAGAPTLAMGANGKMHPTLALWPVALREDLRQSLLKGERKVARWALDHGATTVTFDEVPDPFFNVNTPEDLALAERRL